MRDTYFFNSAFSLYRVLSHLSYLAEKRSFVGSPSMSHLFVHRALDLLPGIDSVMRQARRPICGGGRWKRLDR